MARYKLKETRKGDMRRVDVVKERLQFKLGPLVVCLLMAFLVWLFLTGRDIRKQNQNEGPGTSHAGKPMYVSCLSEDAMAAHPAGEV